ncbi:MAG: 30S ribosomal protein S10 [Alphaproteobacteria bacterium]|nr:30S ribosomal protein S10 [Alphaproteobacteria bacterium]OJV16388.1 MAG: 30S ribosomal protein S10 [Alphaproteobacteria bacterium 33-17]
MNNQKINITLLGFDSKAVDQAASDIRFNVQKTGADICGPIPLPTKIEKFTVNRSPHIDKESREQFEVRTHKRLLVIYPTQHTIEALMKLELPAGVEVQIKLVEAA